MCNFFKVVLFLIKSPTLLVIVNTMLLRRILSIFNRISQLIKVMNKKVQKEQTAMESCCKQGMLIAPSMIPGIMSFSSNPCRVVNILCGRKESNARKEYRNGQGGQTSVLCEAFTQFLQTRSSAIAL